MIFFILEKTSRGWYPILHEAVKVLAFLDCLEVVHCQILNMRYYRLRDDLLNLSDKNKVICQCIPPTGNILLQKGVDAPHKKICNVKSTDFPFPLGESSSSLFFP